MTPDLTPYEAQLTADQRVRLAADPVLRAEFERGLLPHLPAPVGVSWGSEDRWVPVRAVFENAERALRFAARRMERAA